MQRNSSLWNAHSDALYSIEHVIVFCVTYKISCFCVVGTASLSQYCFVISDSFFSHGIMKDGNCADFVVEDARGNAVSYAQSLEGPSSKVY